MEFIFDNQTSKAISNEVEVLDGQSYRDGILKNRIKPILEATTIKGLLDVLEPTKQGLQTLGTEPFFTFTKSDRTLENPNVLSMKTLVDLTKCRPSHATQLHIEAIEERYNVGGEWILSNKLGLGERVQLQARLQPKPYCLASGAASIESPTPIGRGLVKLTGFFFNEDRVWSSYAFASHGLSLELKVPWIANFIFKGGAHAVARHIHSINEGASDTIRAAAGTSSLKVSASAELSHKGAYHNALAMIETAKPGDTQHLKSVGSLDVNFPLTPRRELELDLRGQIGYISSENNIPKLCDNFLIGGPGSIIGFKPFCVGPHDGSDYIGGQAFYTSRLAILGKIPYKKAASPLRMKAQIELGVLRTNSSDTMGSNLRSLLEERATSSSSIGLTYKTDRASFDILYVLPGQGGDAEVRQQGIHIGAQLNLL